ncbi:hypothetical protein GKQ38_03020 [Candidatus Nanohaloarchaea archaeon]|nr:hypothetical protein GKQ38_03020 [Candidatus Nanohaloarchaea archaeon]
MNRKGVTPVVATSLLLLISIATVSTSAIFLSDTVDDVGEGVKERLGVDSKEQKAELSIEYGYRGSNGNIWLEVTNDGDMTLATEEDGVKLWNIYSDGNKLSWTYAYGAPSDNALDPGDTVTIDTMKAYPAVGSSTTIVLRGQYDTSSSIVCSNSNGEDSC